ncbi:sugar kinase [bacterium]|nr:sugar kinase [bacterium]
MKTLRIKSQKSCKYDLVALGEVMLRLDPGEDRIHNAVTFRTWEGGGEYNVAKGLSSCFGLRAGIVTALVDNEIGRLIESKMMQGKVDTDLVQWFPFDGVGSSARNGVYFMERGFGLRNAKGMSDRGNTAVSQLKEGDIDWEDLFGNKGVRWFHTGGIFAGLSETTPRVILEAMSVAKKHGTVISYDLNYRSSLWKSKGGKSACDQVNKQFKPYLDVQIGVDNLPSSENPDWEHAMHETVDNYSNISLVVSNQRTTKSASRNDWGAVCMQDGQFIETPQMKDLEIYDRVGSGDAFASGLIFGLLSGKNIKEALQYGQAHGALVMTTPGDTSMSTLEEVETLVKGEMGIINR